MMGVTFSVCSYVYGDNMSVIHNTQQPESTLRKKSNSICYHSVSESVSIGDTKTAQIYTHDNSSDLLTKVLYGSKRKKFVREICMTFIIDFFLFARSNPLYTYQTLGGFLFFQLNGLTGGSR